MKANSSTLVQCQDFPLLSHLVLEALNN
ncbi:hypothetical protein P5673_009821, partial [Acropora cervicornis]